jgi:hypothetical protein
MPGKASEATLRRCESLFQAPGVNKKGYANMSVSLVIAIYFYDGKFYLPTCVRSLEGMIGFTGPIAIVPADNRTAVIEEIELRAVAGNATVSRADFRNTTDNILVDAMRFPNRGAFYAKTKRWSIVEEDGSYTLIPFKPAPMRGVVEDREHALTLPAAGFAGEAVELICAQIE